MSWRVNPVWTPATLVRTLARWVLGLFYRRIDLVGLENIPESGPLIVAANHQNALVDPMLLLGLLPRRLVPVAKAPLFRHPLIGPLLRGALPVHQAVLICPEGVSHPDPALMPLRCDPDASRG